jgi:Flp pilus assembly CpaE family ATPase
VPPIRSTASPKSWRERGEKELRALAQSVTGRTPENKRQAVEMIEGALAAKAAK